MQDKILSFIINNHNELLLLRNNPTDPAYGGDFWYTVTGGCEDYDKTKADAVVREIKEETNLDVKETMYLNWVFKYSDKGINCTEYAHISFVEKTEITLDETENVDYIWCGLDEFVERIRWFDDLKLLKEVLSYGINKKIFFDVEHIENYNFNFETIGENKI